METPTPNPFVSEVVHCSRLHEVGRMGQGPFAFVQCQLPPGHDGPHTHTITWKDYRDG